MDNLYVQETGRKYSRTTTLIQLLSGAKLPVYVEAVSYDDNQVAWLLGSNYTKSPALGKPNDYTETVKFKLKDIEILPTPDTRVFDYNGRTLVFKRSPHRQFRKGLCGENSTVLDVMLGLISNLKSDKLMKVVSGTAKMSSLVAHHLLTSSHARTVEKALADIKEHKLLSRSVSDVYWLGLYPSEVEQYILYRYEIPLAYYMPETDEFFLIGKGYSQEVQDFVRRLKMNSGVRYEN